MWRGAPMFYVDCQGRLLDKYEPSLNSRAFFLQFYKSAQSASRRGATGQVQERHEAKPHSRVQGVAGVITRDRRPGGGPEGAADRAALPQGGHAQLERVALPPPARSWRRGLRHLEAPRGHAGCGISGWRVEANAIADGTSGHLAGRPLIQPKVTQLLPPGLAHGVVAGVGTGGPPGEGAQSRSSPSTETLRTWQCLRGPACESPEPMRQCRCRSRLVTEGGLFARQTQPWPWLPEVMGGPRPPGVALVLLAWPHLHYSLGTVESRLQARPP